LDDVDLIECTYPNGASISVRFKCAKCSRLIVAQKVEIPAYAEGCYVFGDSVYMECECGAEYEVQTNNSISGWDVEIERHDCAYGAKAKKPKGFQYQLEADYGLIFEDFDEYEECEECEEDKDSDGQWICET